MLYKSISSLLIIGLSVMMTTTSRADVTVKINGKNGQDSVIQIKGNIGRMTTPGGQDYLVFNTATGVAVHADPGRGTYMEMDEAQINRQMEQAAALKKQMAPQLKMMKEQMENMDPATRKMLEKRMGSMKGLLNSADSNPQSLPKPKLVKQGNKKVAGLSCEANKVVAGGKHVADVCLMKSASGKISKQDYATLEATMKFFRNMAKKASGMMGSSDSQRALALANMDGVPISIDEKQGGDSFVVESVSNDKLPDSLFTDYKKLKKRNMPGLAQ